MLSGFPQKPFFTRGPSAETGALRDDRESHHPQSSAGAKEVEIPGSAQKEKLMT